MGAMLGYGPMSNRPNVILICVDQWRGDCLSIAGHPVVHTPWLDQMALHGARFERAYAACPTCIAARASLFTGLTPRSHGRVGYQDGVPWDYPTTLAGEFTRHGYQTQAVGKMHVFPERSQVGFQNVILHDGYLHHVRDRHPRDLDLCDDYLPWLRRELGRDADDFDIGLNCNSFVARPWDKPEHVHPTAFVATQSIDFLRRRDPRKPFFLFMSFHRPHPPLDPPAWAFEQYATRDIPPPPVGDWADEVSALHEAPFRDPHRPDLNVGRMDPVLLRRARAAYYGQMSFIDHQLNRFFETLSTYGLARETFICFVSDHGELLGDHHLFRKSLPYEGSARVPLLLKGPASSGIAQGRVHLPVAELCDVMPTLLDCAGLPIPATLEGRSLLPIARGNDVAWRTHLHGEHTYAGGAVHYVTDGREKYLWFSRTGMEQLFDLTTDPHEQVNLARQPTQASRVARWRGVLVDELKGREEGFTDGHVLIPGRPVVNVLSHLRR